MAFDSLDEINIYVNLGGMFLTGAILIFNTLYYGRHERYRSILKEIEKMQMISSVTVSGKNAVFYNKRKLG